MRDRRLTNVLLVVLAAAIFVLALVMGTKSGDFGGTDSAATDTIEKSDPGYKPWFTPLWTQPGGEVESGLFAMQAALGAGFLGFVLGTFRERRKMRDAAAGVVSAGGGAVRRPVSGRDATVGVASAAGDAASARAHAARGDDAAATGGAAAGGTNVSRDGQDVRPGGVAEAPGGSRTV